jgi:AcrR family transcriptional regulator
MRDRKKHIILESFNSLLSQYPFDRITVEMIANKSGISKATFYRYFMDKYDVMNFSYKRLVENLFIHEACHSWKDLFYHLAYESKRDAVRVGRAYSSQGENSYPNFLFDYSFKKVEEVTIRCRGTGLTPEEEVGLTIFCHGTVGVTHFWVCGKLNTTAEGLAQQLYNAMPETLRDLW